MSGELKSLLRRYEQGMERVDVAKLRVLLQKTSASDRWDIICPYYKGHGVARLMKELFVDSRNVPRVLHSAARSNDVETVRCMLEGFQLDQICDVMKIEEGPFVLKDTALSIAAYYGSMDMVKFILDSMQGRKLELLIWNWDRDAPLHEGESVLHTAVSKGHTNIVKYILESVPNEQLDLLKLQNRKWKTVLQAAVDDDNMEMVQCILSVLSEDQRYEVLTQQAVLHAAATKGYTNIVKSILESVPNKALDLLKLRYGQEENTPLHTAAIEKKSETVLTILQSVTQEGLKELRNIKNNQNQSIADLAAPELHYLYTAQELAGLKKSSEEKDTVIAGQAEEIDDNRQKLAAVERQLRDDLAKQTEDNTEQIKQIQLEKQQQDKELAVLKESSEQKDTVIVAQTEELAVLKKSSEEKDTVIAGQAKEIDDNRQKLEAVERQLRDDLAKQTEGNAEQIKQVQLEKQQQDKDLTALKEKQTLQETTVKRQAEELAVLKESGEQKDTVIARQAEELQQLRHNQTEMLKMIEALEIYLGKPTSDQEHETDSDN